jgi:hypothetical protein
MPQKGVNISFCRKFKHELYNVEVTVLEHARCLSPKEISAKCEIICHNS